MQPRVSYITLAVNDLAASLAFYRDGLGLATEGIIGEEYENGAVVFFQLQPGLILALWPRTSLASDTGLTSGSKDPTGFMLAHNVNQQQDVEKVMAEAEAAGAAIVKAPAATSWGGYAGCFQDPDGHLWEVVWNPKFVVPA